VSESRYTEKQIIAFLMENQAGVSTNEICRKYGFSPAAFIEWRLKYSHLTISRTNRALKWSFRLFEKVLKAISTDLYLKTATFMVNELNLTATVQTKKGPILFKCDSETVRIRVREMLRREPDTLDWIETFNPDDVLWDIGANIGVFTLYASFVASARVVAIEPLPQNYLNLIQNLMLNELTDKVMPFCIAISDETVVATFHIPRQANTPGGAGGTFGSRMNNYGHFLQAEASHSALGYSIDTFIETFDVPFPNHIKIDIDGIQEKVILGSKKTLNDARLKTVMIELQRYDTPTARSSSETIIKEIENAGFSCVKIAPAGPDDDIDRESSVTNNFFRRV
jgi:FkbM family methyltransferase